MGIGTVLKKFWQPYQPLLLRTLHGFVGVMTIGAILTALWTYDTYDGRWGRVYWPKFPAIEGIHGTFGLWVLLIFPAFAIYAFHRGQRRLIQKDSLAKLKRWGRPMAWYALHQMVNTLMVLALTFALFSGKMMSSDWLPQGELYHFWYYAHLSSWVILVCSFGLHLLMSARVGGWPLLVSMWRWQFRENDSPSHWLAQVQQGWQVWKSAPLRSWLSMSALLRVLEAIVLISVAAAWIIPLFKH